MHPTISQYAEALEELTQGAAAGHVADVAKRFLGFLEHRGEQEKIGAIVRHLEKAAAQRDDRVSVAIVTASEATEENKNTFARVADKLFPEKKVTFRYAVDGAVIGGARFSTEELLYDATLAARLRALKNTL